MIQNGTIKQLLKCSSFMYAEMFLFKVVFLKRKGGRVLEEP